MSTKPNGLDVVDPSGLRDADWADIDRLQRLYETGDRNALSKALAELGESDPVRSMRVLHALFPHTVREALKDALAEEGITEEELRDLIRKRQPRESS